MDLNFTPEEQAFRAEIRAWVAENLPKDISHKVHNALHLTREDMQRWAKILGKKGWHGWAWPKQFGGPGWNVIQRHLFEEECALAGAPRVVPFGTVMVAPVIMAFGIVTTAPGGTVRFKDILQHFEARMHLHPLFRRRLVQVPFGLDRPYWVADSNVDVEYHIRHIALPKPGDWRQLMIQVARLHSRPLDRAHPLWEAYVIEGLDNVPKLPPGAFAVFLKIHHAIVDGMAAVHLIRELHTSTPENEAPAEGSRTVIADRDPSGIELFARGVDNNVRQEVSCHHLSQSPGLFPEGYPHHFL